MATGLLKVAGTVDLAQFWPIGNSDADTVKILVTVGPASFKFRPWPTAAWKTTQVFFGAKVVGKQGAKPAIDAKNRIVVRLQGVDAPELHYRPTADRKRKGPNDPDYDKFLTLNEDYRQLRAETAAVELGKLLDQGGLNHLPCELYSRVDHPNEVFDTYARFVGNIVVRIKAKNVDINRWLLQQGWAVPTFYSSMGDDEIATLTADATKAKKAKAGVWPLKKTVGHLDFDLVLRRSPTVADPAKDKGPSLMPKLFRRLCTWETNKKAGLVAATFENYLRAKKDGCFLVDDFLANGSDASTLRTLDEFVSGHGSVMIEPQRLVFREASSLLKDADNKTVKKW